VKALFENLLIEQCAPTLAGVKPGNLFIYTAGDGENIPEILDYWNNTFAA